jgi:coenzyme F420 hydrogenase subunit beta
MKNLEGIVKKGLCIGCGICAYSEEIGKTVYSEKRDQFIPLITKENKRDELAYNICPGKGYNIIEESEILFKSAKYDLELGRVFDQYAAFSNDKQILERASSGGIMSHIAIFLLESKTVDRVLTTQFSYEGEPRTVCILAKSREEILQSQGSKYCPVDLSNAIREIKNNDYCVAIIGTPCQIAGIRNIQKIDQSFNKNIFITIANFCGGFKSYNNIRLIAKRKGIKSNKIKFFRFRGNGQPGSMLIEETTGKKIELPYPKYVGLNGISKHLRCHLCVDATGELADLACGDAWLPRFLEDINPWSVLITRNEKADDLVKRMRESNMITTQSISLEDIKKSQHENINSKKVRQKSRYYLYKILGFTLPSFDGGYHENKIKIWTEIKVYTKHKIKSLLEKLHLFQLVYKIVIK